MSQQEVDLHSRIKALTLDSGILLLQQHQWQQANPENEPGLTYHFFPETLSALETLDRISMTLREGGYEAWQYLEDGHCTLFLVELVYQAILILMKISRGQPAVEVKVKIESLKWLLAHMENRWPLVCRFAFFAF